MRCGWVMRSNGRTDTCQAKANASGACSAHERQAIRTAGATDSSWAGQIVRNMIRAAIEREEAKRIAAAAVAAVRKAAASKPARQPTPTTGRPKRQPRTPAATSDQRRPVRHTAPRAGAAVPLVHVHRVKPYDERSWHVPLT